eukprot:1519568-Rhodomonas_salina.1
MLRMDATFRLFRASRLMLTISPTTTPYLTAYQLPHTNCPGTTSQAVGRATNSAKMESKPCVMTLCGLRLPVP